MADAPDEILELARARSAARSVRDWAEADVLKDRIESAGWKVVDRGTEFALQPAHPPDLPEGDRVRYGWSGSVPSRLPEAPTHGVTVVMPVVDATDRPSATLDAIRAHGRADLEVVVVADGPVSTDLAADEVVLSAGLGHAGAINAGVKRAGGSIVVLVDPAVELTADAITPLVEALGDSTVAAAGAFGLASTDLRRFTPAPAGEAVALEDALLAFRRVDFAERGPIDEHFRLPGSAGTWWSLVLRDEGEDRRPRRALALDLPVVRPSAERSLTAEEARLAKRDFYRVLDRFGTRRDLLLPSPG
jgi:hypothetical protein